MASSTTPSLLASCHCGGIEILLPSLPEFVKECQCSACYKYGALWGYLHRKDVQITTSHGATLEKYVRSDEGSDGDISFNRCSRCGCMVCWFGEVVPPTGWDGPERMAVNCRMLPKEAIEGIERRVVPGPGN